MKRVFRKGLFETNSSSCHSVIVGKNSNMHYPYNTDIIKVSLKEYGWSGDAFCDFINKLEYALSMVLITEYPGFSYYDNNFVIDYHVLSKCKGYQTLLNAIQNHMDCEKIIIYRNRSYYPYGYIDHQSYEDYHSLQDFLDNYEIDVERYLFDDNVFVNIDNDN